MLNQTRVSYTFFFIIKALYIDRNKEYAIKFFIFLLLLLSNTAFATSETKPATQTKITPEQLVLKQLDAYNDRDIEAFLDTYSDDIKIYDFPDRLTISGKKQMRKMFSEFFQMNPNLNARVGKTMVQGNFVIIHEVVSGLANGSTLSVVAIYEVDENNQIKHLSFLW